MPDTSVEICNLALAHLGEASIVSTGDGTTAANACLQCYAPTRDEVLRSHRWNFATQRAVLSPLETAPAFGWIYQFTLPADCLRVLEVNEDDSEQSKSWLIEGGKLLTNESSVRLLYIASIDDVTLFDALFVSALSLRLAVALAEIIRGSTARTEQLTTQYERITAPLARRVDANETRRRKGLRPMNSLAIQARFRGM